MSSDSFVTPPMTRNARVTSTGLRVMGSGLSFEQWAAIGRSIAHVSSGIAWALGDWLIYGEQTYADRYRSAIESTQLDYQTLRNLAWVARAFDSSRRREGLSFSHHAEVAVLPEPEQELWLPVPKRSRGQETK